MFYPVLLAYSFLLTGDCDCTAPMFCVLSIRRIRNLYDTMMMVTMMVTMKNKPNG